METLVLRLPEGWVVESVPENMSFQNAAGRCAFVFIPLEGELRIQRLFAIERPVPPTEEYETIRELFEKSASMREVSVVLTSAAVR